MDRSEIEYKLKSICMSIPTDDSGNCMCPYNDDPDSWCCRNIKYIPEEHLVEALKRLEGIRHA